MEIDDFYKKIMDEQFGRRRGSLWRTDKDWYVFAAKDPDGTLKQAAEHVRSRTDGLQNEKGYSRSRKMRYMGSIPYEVAIANPELLYDPEAAKRFFKEFPAFSSKK